MDRPAHVLYVDHAGHPAPLSECYHATASRRLASSAYRWPTSTTYGELESAYCPHCLSSQDGPTASRSPHCSKPTCQLCPVCLSATGIVTGNRPHPSSSKGNEEDGDGEPRLLLLLYYQCGSCDWTSLECDVAVPVGISSSSAEKEESGGDRRPSSSSSTAQGVDRLQLARAAEDLLQKLTALRGSALLRGVERQYADISKHWEGVRRSASSSLSPSGDGGTGRRGGAAPTRWRRTERTSRLDPSDPAEGWSVSALESQLRARKEESTASATGGRGGVQVQESLAERGAASDGPDLSLDDLDLDESLGDLSTVAFQLQALHNGLGARSKPSLGEVSAQLPPINPIVRRRDLLPLPIQLRPRKSRRCRAELREGRAGILLKPRLNPLEGDSSLRSGHGQWWKKDSSAVHVIPSVAVVKCVKTTWDDGAEAELPNPGDGVADSVAPRRRRRIVMLLKVTNPTLGSLRLRFAASPYVGEPDWDGEDADDMAKTGDPNQFTDVLPGLLVHTFTQTFWDVEFDSGVLRGLPTSETVELHSAEDSIIEMGGHKARQTPPEVVSWGPSEAATSTSGAGPALRLVTQRASSAWFELAFVEPARFCGGTESAERHRIRDGDSAAAWAVALRLEVEVGPGSWETSLIPPLPTAADDATAVDRVPFDLVVVYQ